MALTNTLLPYVGPMTVAVAMFAYTLLQGTRKPDVSYAKVRHRR